MKKSLNIDGKMQGSSTYALNNNSDNPVKHSNESCSSVSSSSTSYDENIVDLGSHSEECLQKGPSSIEKIKVESCSESSMNGCESMEKNFSYTNGNDFAKVCGLFVVFQTEQIVFSNWIKQSTETSVYIILNFFKKARCSYWVYIVLRFVRLKSITTQIALVNQLHVSVNV